MGLELLNARIKRSIRALILKQHIPNSIVIGYSQSVMQDLGFFFFGGGGLTRKMGWYTKLYFVLCHGYLKRGAFAGSSEGGSPSEDRRILKILQFFQISNIKFLKIAKLLKNSFTGALPGFLSGEHFRGLAS